MFVAQLGSPWGTLALVALSTTAIYLALIVYSRLAGLRSFAQMTNFDVAATVALGSITATTAVSTEVSLLQGAAALGVLFALQWLIARVRKWDGVQDVIDNRPLLLMVGTTVIEENLVQGQMTRDDVRAKIRLAGVTRMDRVRAVVLESTGEVSVLTDDPGGEPLDPDLFTSVRGYEWLIGDRTPPGKPL
ncbi:MULTISPECIES: DUF421 domain-containing protein [Prauserella salsuginis group]|uniref:Uncharacterized membrane protein YcaP (DUF421 family) n=2 Tax=Prauserella salsuginis group TaxID=2893672 RepID=A0A839XU01_9PSEU|nr:MULTISPECIES: YetF domain-containing protein [Prauserella salsuginis group]MBB3664043.1 uncharacterized membrane protein YcaP (DUF421 family) [Prauserella sediminis]MCR3721498.1 Uncharacterized membrane protein YcaP, DUF421 family [Prauserella flava]MCR3734190.1 Uncharacterized membrane protein YcaP, DUF421 family [Prauserella salsuginis]